METETLINRILEEEDYYKLLNVNKTSENTEIRKAYIQVFSFLHFS